MGTFVALLLIFHCNF